MPRSKDKTNKSFDYNMRSPSTYNDQAVQATTEQANKLIQTDDTSRRAPEPTLDATLPHLLSMINNLTI